MAIMRSALALSTAVLVAASITGCRGKVLAKAELHNPGMAEATFQSTGKKVTLWADTVGEWTGDSESRLEVSYDIDVIVNGVSSGHVACSTTESSSSVCSSSVTINESHKAKCERKLQCELPPIPAGANVVLRVTGRTGPNVKSVEEMSLNVRAS